MTPMLRARVIYRRYWMSFALFRNLKCLRLNDQVRVRYRCKTRCEAPLRDYHFAQQVHPEKLVVRRGDYHDNDKADDFRGLRFSGHVQTLVCF